MHKINVNKTTMRSRQLWYLQTLLIIKGNNIITEHRSIFQRERQNFISEQTDKISQQPENWENRNGPDLVQVFPKKWWVRFYGAKPPASSGIYDLQTTRIK